MLHIVVCISASFAQIWLLMIDLESPVSQLHFSSLISVFWCFLQKLQDLKLRDFDLLPLQFPPLLPPILRCLCRARANFSRKWKISASSSFFTTFRLILTIISEVTALQPPFSVLACFFQCYLRILLDFSTPCSSYACFQRLGCFFCGVLVLPMSDGVFCRPSVLYLPWRYCSRTYRISTYLLSSPFPFSVSWVAHRCYPVRRRFSPFRDGLFITLFW